MKLDRIDFKILKLLQQDASVSIAELAESVGLSPTPCGRRIRQMEESGLIDKQVILLNQKQIGLPITVLVQMSLTNQTRPALHAFEEEIVQLPEVMECFLITGSDSDYVLKVVAASLDHYQELLLDKLTTMPGVRSIVSNFVMRQSVRRTAYDLSHLSR